MDGDKKVLVRGGEVVEALEKVLFKDKAMEKVEGCIGALESRMMELEKLGWRNLYRNCQTYQGWDNL